jgi:hypothetical protein
MNKKLLSIIFIILAAVLGYCLYQSLPLQKALSDRASSSAPVSVVPFATSSVAIYKPFDSSNFFKEETMQRTFVGPVSRTIITLEQQHAQDIAHQSRNPEFDVFVGQEKVGRISGYLREPYGFSPDGRYLALRSVATIGCAGVCQNYTLSLVDLEKRTVISVNPPRNSGFIQDKGDFMDITDFMESVIWDDHNNLNMIFFLVGIPKTQGQYYRVTSKEAWSYDPAIQEYTFIKTLPEANE